MNPAYELALKEVGTVEWKDGHNPKVLAYFRDAGHAYVKDDETAWCAAFVGAMLARAGIKPSGKLTARSYLEWGHPVQIEDARPGDVVVIPRGKSSWQGHVFFFVRRVGAFVEGLGGNQSDAVNVQRFPVSKILGVRRPPRPASNGVKIDTSVAAMVKPGAASKPVEMRKADPVQPPRPVTPPPAPPTTPAPAPKPAAKGRRFNLGWFFATLVALASVLWAKIEGLF